MSERRLSRRSFLQASTVAATGALLVACAPASQGDDAGEGEAPSEALAQINLIVSGWVDAAWKVTERSKGFNEQVADGYTVDVQAVPEGWETKALSQIEQGAPSWDGYMTHHPFRVAVQWLAQGLIMPIDEFMATSSMVDMDTYWESTVSPELIRFDCSVKDQTVGIPLGIDTCCQAINADLMKEADLPHTREDFMAEASWPQIQVWAEQLREMFKDRNVWGISTWQVYHQSLGAIFQSITDNLYYGDEGLIRFDSEEMQESLRIQSEWSWSGAAPVPAWGQPGEGGDIFPGGRGAIWQGQVGVVGAAQRVLGTETIPYAMPVLVEEGGTGGNQWYTTCGYALNKSEHPQEVVDFYLHMFGPESDENARLTLEFNWFPVFADQWDKQIEENPDFGWSTDFIPQIQNADLIPRNPYYEIEHNTARKYSELVHAQKMEVAEACQTIMDEVRDQVSKMDIDW